MEEGHAFGFVDIKFVLLAVYPHVDDQQKVWMWACGLKSLSLSHLFGILQGGNNWNHRVSEIIRGKGMKSKE